MKRLFSHIVLGLAWLLVVPVAAASPILFVTDLLGTNENPANASPGVGYGYVIFDSAAHTMFVHVEFSGLLGNTTAAHIHCCVAPPGNVGVATELPTFTGFPLGVTSGVYDHLFDTSLDATWNPAFIAAHGGTVAGAEAFFLAGMIEGKAYLNLHSTMFPGGEIRGNLVVPEPATLALLGLALAGIGFARRRR